MINRLFAANAALSWRRLAVFVVATALLLNGAIDQATWLWVAVAFIGVEGAQRVTQLAMQTRATPTEGT